MKQTIEVELTGDEVSTLREWDGNPRYWMGDKLRDALPVPAPERTEYALHDRGFAVDEVLVAAHSLRVGDRLEWAPGDWREIVGVERTSLDSVLIAFDDPDERRYLDPWVPVAVRR